SRRRIVSCPPARARLASENEASTFHGMPNMSAPSCLGAYLPYSNHDEGDPPPFPDSEPAFSRGRTCTRRVDVGRSLVTDGNERVGLAGTGSSVGRNTAGREDSARVVGFRSVAGVQAPLE